ncbi:MAG: chromosome partitioning protein, partial [Stutzerimonas stutzeri]
ILDSAEISHAAMRMMTIYELEKPIGTSKTHKRSRTNLDEALLQVEQLVRQSWGRVEPLSEAAVIDAAA